jgi:hypothetical protein
MSEGLGWEVATYKGHQVVRHAGGYDLPSLIASVKKSPSAAGGKADDPPPVSAKQLSLPPEAYAGAYANEHWGSLRASNTDGRLAVTVGDAPAPVRSIGTDAFRLRTDRVWRDSRFVIEGWRVAAVVVHWEGSGDVRFDRKPK